MPICKYCDCRTSTSYYNYDLDKYYLCVENDIKETVYPVCDCGRSVLPNKVHYCNKKVSKEKEKEDIINKPNHYHEGGVDLFEFGEQKFSKEEMRGFYRLNVMKYLTRAGKKDDIIQDLKKAERYLKQLIELEMNKNG